jgi:hypothetical protein
MCVEPVIVRKCIIYLLNNNTGKTQFNTVRQREIANDSVAILHPF